MNKITALKITKYEDNSIMLILHIDGRDNYYAYQFAEDGQVEEDGWYVVGRGLVSEEELEQITSTINAFPSDLMTRNIESFDELAPLLTEENLVKSAEWVDLPKGLPEGGNNGDVLTKVITTSGSNKLKDSYTFEELENFYGDLEIEDYKGIYRESDRYEFDVTAYKNFADDSIWYKLIFRAENGEYNYNCTADGSEDGWYDSSSSTPGKLDHAPELIIPDNLTKNDFEYISDISEMDVLLNPIEKVEWKPIDNKIDDCLDPLSTNALSNRAINEQLEVLTRDLLAGVGGGSGGTSGAIQYLTEEPSADNTDGLKIVILDYEPDTMYKGYMYITLNLDED